jgi:hypothetical protein
MPAPLDGPTIVSKQYVQHFPAGQSIEYQRDPRTHLKDLQTGLPTRKTLYSTPMARC